MVKRIRCILIFMTVFLIPIILAQTFAYNTAINIRDSPNKELIVKTINLDTGKTVRSIPLTIGSSGMGTTEFQTNIEKIMAVVYEIKNKSDFLKEDNIISSKTVGPFSVADNTAININFITNQHNLIPGSTPMGGEAETSNETTANETTTNEETVAEEAATEETTESEEIIEEPAETSNEGITGNVIISDGNSSFPFYYYIIGIVFMAMLITVFVLKRSLSKHSNSEFKVKGNQKALSDEEEERELEDAEQRIKDAEEEIKRIRNKKSGVREAEEKFLKAKEELERIKKGG